MKVHKSGVLLAALALLAAGCRGDDGDGGGGEGGVDAPGVTGDACPEAVNEDNGCIYLGQISDLTAGPFAPLGVPITDSQKAFWQRVNEEGGIGGYDIDASEFVRDNLYNPETHQQVYTEIEPDVLALAQTLGSPTTFAILPRLKEQEVIAAPASWTSLWEFEANILESGTNYCFEEMNIVDYMVEQQQIESVMTVGFPGDYGGDGAAGGQIAADANGLDYDNVETAPGPEQGTAIDAVVDGNPDLVILATSPTEAAAIVGESAARGYKGQFVGLGPTWNPALLQTDALPALQAQYLASGYWGTWGTDTPGHNAMREALGEVEQPNDGYTSGWVWSYAVKAALEAWLDGDYSKDRAGLIEAVGELETVDYEGMLPEEAGNFVGDPNDTVFRQSLLSEVDPAADTGITVIEDFFVGPTAEAYDFQEACYQG